MPKSQSFVFVEALKLKVVHDSLSTTLWSETYKYKSTKYETPKTCFYHVNDRSMILLVFSPLPGTKGGEDEANDAEV